MLNSLLVLLVILFLQLPTIYAAEGEQEVSLGLPQLIGNFYQWALGIGGLVALGVIVYGGILYTVSAGNASRQDDAKQWIASALIGLLLLFGSFLILNTINPELTKLKDLRLTANKAAEPSTDFLNNPSPTPPGTLGDSCGSYYNSNNAPNGNFGDLSCEYATDQDKFKNDLLSFLKQSDPTYVNQWFYKVIPCETGGTYSPNAHLTGDRTASIHSPDPDGACGLFQTDCGCQNPPDCGAVEWRTQVSNAVQLLQLLRGRGASYWACW